MISLWTAFTIGLFGSFHCIGMCGPIAAALPYPSQDKWQSVWAIILYNSGRTITYALLGLTFGILGASFSLVGMQQFISIFLGVFFLLAGVFSFNIDNTLLKWSWTSRIYFFVKRQLAIQLRNHTNPTLFFIGLMNGLLPCGLVYVALAGAVASGSVLGGVSWMIAFGLGTVPLMMSVALSSNFINIQTRNFFKKSIPFVLALFGVLLLMRGLKMELPVDWYLADLVSGRTFCH